MGLELEGAHEAELNFWRPSPFLEKGLRPTLDHQGLKGVGDEQRRSPGHHKTTRGEGRRHCCQGRRGDPCRKISMRHNHGAGNFSEEVPRVRWGGEARRERIRSWEVGMPTERNHFYNTIVPNTCIEGLIAETYT